MPNDEPPPQVTVDLVDEETVVAHGTRKVTWFVRDGDAWTHPSEAAGCVLESRSPGPGTVWERVATLTLPIGTELMRVETRPRPERHADPLAYLQREVRNAARHTRRSYYQVGPRGRLVPRAS